jgi:hypothetical protein
MTRLRSRTARVVSPSAAPRPTIRIEAFGVR